MTREARRTRIAALVAPRLEDGEELLSSAVAWAARVGRTPLLLTGRHLHQLALTDRRLLVFGPRARSGDDAEPVLDESIDDLSLERTRSLVGLHQVRVRSGDGRDLVFEFRLRDRATGRALAERLGAAPRR